MNFCPSCGQRLIPGARFCAHCGRPLTEAEPKAPVPAEQEASASTPELVRFTPETAGIAPETEDFAVPAAAPSPDPTAPGLASEADEAPVPEAPSPGTERGEVLATLPKLQGPSYVRPIYYPTPTPAPAKPADPMARAYRLTTLGTLVNYAMVSQVASAVLSVGAVFCVLFLLQRGSFHRLDVVNDILENNTALSVLLAIYAVGYVGGLLLGLLVSRTIRRRLPAQPPEQRALSVGAFLRCALAAFGLWGVGVLVGNFPAYIVPIDTMDFGWNSVPIWLLAIIAAPIFEEIIFRKLVLDRVGRFGETPAVLCSALIFGLAHQNAGQFFLAFLLGILFARIYLRTGKIVYTMLLHFMINFTATFDEVGVLLWGAGFDLWFMIGLGVLTLAGIVLLIIYRKDPILGWPGKLSYEERKNAFRPWSVTLVKWICVASILIYGLLYALLGLLGGSFTLDDSVRLDPLGLLYLIPAVLATVFILILARRPRRQSAPAPAAPAAAVPEAEQP